MSLNLPDFNQASAATLSTQIQSDLDQLQGFVSTAKPCDSGLEALNQLIELEQLETQLERSWGLLLHLNSVTSTDKLRSSREALQPKVAELYSKMGQNEQLFSWVQQVLADTELCSSLSEARMASLKQAELGFKLSGIDLPEAQKQRFEALSIELSQLSSHFSDTVLDATQSYVLELTEQDVQGLPESALAQLKAAATQKNTSSNFAATLDVPVYMALMTYAKDQQLRKTLYKAYTTRASHLFEPNPELDNGPVMEQILKLRQEKAKLLGFNNFAELSLQRKMASSPAEVLEFLQDLAQRARPFAQNDLAQLKEQTAKEGLSTLEPWDVAYLSEQIRSERYQVSQEELRPYFEFNTVKNGLFEVASRLFGVSIELAAASVWDPEVEFYQLKDADSGELVGGFYLDPFARSGKRGGAWMNGVEARYMSDTGVNLPVVYLVCNLTPPTKDTPSCLTFNEVTTLFHEFGHGLHHLFSEVDAPAVSGVNGVEWDAVELPSQLLENWALTKEGLSLISAHVDTKEPLPEVLLERLLAARFFQSGWMTLRQIEFALFDMRIHAEDVTTQQQIDSVLADVRSEVSLLAVPEFNKFAHSFSHIFAGGYAAGYYSYKWAELLAFDTFERFEEEGLFSREVGLSLRSSILSKGGSRPAAQNFEEFRGRPPKLDAMLRHSGFVTSA